MGSNLTVARPETSWYNILMSTYELTILFGEKTDKKEVERVTKLVEAAVKKAKGEVNKQESWGEKHLAYPIKKQATATYEHFVLSLDTAAQVELDKVLHLDEAVLRYMFVRA